MMEAVVSYANLTLLVIAVLMPVVFRGYVSRCVYRPARICPDQIPAARRRVFPLRLPQKHYMPEAHADSVL